MTRRDLGGQRADRRRPPAHCLQFEGGGNGRINAGPQPGVGAVPRHGDGMPLGQDRLIAGIVEDELPVREDLVELIPVMAERRAMLVVLGPDLIGQASESVPEFRALAVADNLRAHVTSILGFFR